MTATTPDRFGKLFDLFDFDNDGAITREDLDRMSQQFLAALELPPDSPKAIKFHESSQQTWGYLEPIDTDGDGTISRDEYIAAVNGPAGTSMLGESALDELLRPGLDAEFAAADTDDDGVLSRAEFVRLLGGLGVDHDDADAAFTRLDRNSSGTITKDEYCHAWWDFATGAGTGGSWMLGPPS